MANPHTAARLGPAQEAGTWASKLPGLILLVAGAVVIAAMQVYFNDYILTLASIVLLNVMLATSLSLTNGLTGLFSLGHPAFMTVGGYVAAILTYPARRKGFMMPDLPESVAVQEWSLLPSLLAGGLGAVVLALLVGFPVLRLRGHYLAVATLGLIIIVKTLVNNLDGYTRGGLGLNGLPQLTNLWWVYGWTALTVWACWRIKHSSLGRAMMAIRENEMAASCMGISVVRVRMTAFVLGAFFAGIAGGLMAHLITVITPGTYSILLAFNLIVMIVIGGTGSLTSAVVAAIGLSLLSEFLRPVEEAIELYGMSQVILALMLLLMLIYRPRGLFGSSEPRWRWPVWGKRQ